MTSAADAAAEKLLADWDARADQWLADHADEGLEQIFKVSKGIAGRRLEQPGGPELRMLLLRQKSLVRRWVRQAFVEGAMSEWQRQPGEH